jgi:hypothetical protein
MRNCAPPPIKIKIAIEIERLQSESPVGGGLKRLSGTLFFEDHRLLLCHSEQSEESSFFSSSTIIDLFERRCVTSLDSSPDFAGLRMTC